MNKVVNLSVVTNIAGANVTGAVNKHKNCGGFTFREAFTSLHFTSLHFTSLHSQTWTVNFKHHFLKEFKYLLSILCLQVTY